jgi:phosphatidate cytidylyltransferase
MPRVPADLRARVLVAVPAAAVAVALVLLGGLAFALPVAVLGALALAELHALAHRPAPPLWCGHIAVAALPLAALAGGRGAVLGALAAAIALVFFAHALRTSSSRSETSGEHALGSIAVTALALWWVGLALAHGVLLREQPHGVGLVLDVMVGTFIGDTAAHLLGHAFGRHKLAPRISPAKTVEGLVAGIVVGTGAVVAVAALWQDWLKPAEALALGAAVAVAAPLGDLLESLLKRSAGVKDSGTLFGAHGGVLDRIDALLFAAPAAYYVALAVL